jgi:hypothetical protein
MNRFRCVASLALAVVAVLALAGPVAAGEQVPFKGGYEGEDVGTPLAPPFVSAEVTAGGRAAHLGNFTFTQVAVIDTTTRIGSGVFQFTAANGDTVYGTIVGQATFTPPNVLTILETGTIEGGTGRFAGASGSFNVTRLKNAVTGETICSFEGTISSPGS